MVTLFPLLGSNTTAQVITLLSRCDRIRLDKYCLYLNSRNYVL